jgi:hypothetical protein
LSQESTASKRPVSYDVDSSGDDFEECYLFDAIITDPPYDMAEAARSARGSLIMASEESDTPSLRRGVGGNTDSNTPISPRTSASSSRSVDGVIATLLRIASERLQIGGKLVFFAPHRDQDKSVRISLSISGTGSSEGGRVQVQGQGLVVAEEGSGPALERAAVTAASAVSAVSASLAAVDVGPIGSGYGSGIEQKMSKRKAFKKRAKTQALTHPDGLQGHLLTAPCLSPLSFLPPLPADLVLVEYHQQVMSPTFSRWLCVMQKVETETNGELAGAEE